MIVVSDTSPMIGLAAVGHLDLLRNLYGTLLLPAAVLQEFTAVEPPRTHHCCRQPTEGLRGETAQGTFDFRATYLASSVSASRARSPENGKPAENRRTLPCLP